MVTAYSHNSDGYETAEIRIIGLDDRESAETDDLVTVTTYDEHNNRTSVTDPGGNVTTWVFDDFGRLEEESITIDSITLTRSYEHNDRGQVTEKTDRNGRVIEYVYNCYQTCQTGLF